MCPAKILTPEEEARCVHFLRLLNITSSDDRFLSERGYFSLYLSGLQPEEVGEDVHPDQREFREIVRLLSLAGVEQIRAILDRRQKLREQREAGLGGRTPVPISGGATPLAARTPIPIAPPTPLRTSPQPLSHLCKPVAPPPVSRTPIPVGANRTPTSSGNTPSATPLTPSLTPIPINSNRTPPPSNNTPSMMTPLPTGGSPTSPSGGVRVSDVIIPARTRYSKDIHAMRPNDAHFQHLRELQHAESEKEALELANDYLMMGEFQDAYHILFDFMIAHPLSLNLARGINNIIVQANHFDVDGNRPPYNMLYECEELAALLVKRIPNLRVLKEADVSMTEPYQIVKQVYRSWASHCRALLEYKYHLNSKEWVTRNWIDPREFGFLVEVMRMAIRSMLPLDLLRFVYSEIKQCVEVGSKRVIATEVKRCQFYAECLRIIASPARDTIPDLQFEIYREIIYNYLREGDSSSALTFVKQALMIHKADKDMLRLKQDLEKQ